jgi:hypothetical protein
VAKSIRRLQCVAKEVAEEIAPGVPAGRVVVYTHDGKKLLDVTVPLVCPSPDGAGEVAAAPPPPRPGWDVDDRRALFDGEPVRVAPSRLVLLRVLVVAEGPLSAKELNRLAFAGDSNEENVRFHVRKLRDELNAAFPDFKEDGDVLPGEGGYRLAVR